MKPLTSSIRRQLLAWLLVPILTLWFVGAAITYWLGSDFATTAHDEALLDAARTVASRVNFSGSQPGVDLPPAAVDILRHSEKDRFYYQVLVGGRLISGDASIPPPGNALAQEPDFRDGRIGLDPVCICTIRVPAPLRAVPVIVQVAETLKGREELANNILLGVVVPQLLLIVLAGSAVWFGVARGLAPLRNLQNAVSLRSPSDLRPLAEDNAPKEVKPLVRAINELLDRLREDRQAQKRFVANAAHQLRTPLSGLKMQAELAERLSDPGDLYHALAQIRTSSRRATRLVQQLLALARVEPAAGKSVRMETLDLAAIAREASTELVGQALQKGIDLGFEGPAGCCFIEGNRESLHELASNLIENAILYTQPGGKVTVKLLTPQEPLLVVEDNGPGIPEDLRERVFERFYRALGNNVDGSGLGLAIVREIAASHDAVVALKSAPDGPGTCAEVQFRPAVLLCAPPPAGAVLNV